MITLLIATLIVAGAVLGWFGYRAYLRIQAWGLNMNAQDRIFQSAMPEEGTASQVARKRPKSDSGPVLGGRHLPLGAVGSK